MALAAKADSRAALQRLPVLILRARRRCVQQQPRRTIQKRLILFPFRFRQGGEPRGPGIGPCVLRHRRLELDLQRATQRSDPTRSTHRSRTRTMKTEDQSTPTKASTTMSQPPRAAVYRLPENVLPRAAVHRLPGRRRRRKSIRARRPRRAQPSGPPTTCVEPYGSSTVSTREL